MAINLTRAWTASTLTPGLIPVSGTTSLGTAAPAATNSGILNSIMASIFGSNYGSLLSGANQNQASGSSAQDAAFRAYANAMNAKAASIDYASRMEDLARANMSHLAATPVAANRGFLQPAINPDWTYFSRQQEQANAAASRWSGVAQQAALSPAYAPNLQSSVGPQNVGAQWNPFAASGWVSPAQVIPSRGADSARNLMALGV